MQVVILQEARKSPNKVLGVFARWQDAFNSIYETHFVTKKRIEILSGENLYKDCVLVQVGEGLGSLYFSIIEMDVENDSRLL